MRKLSFSSNKNRFYYLQLQTLFNNASLGITEIPRLFMSLNATPPGIISGGVGRYYFFKLFEFCGRMDLAGLVVCHGVGVMLKKIIFAPYVFPYVTFKIYLVQNFAV